jgi:hypothetical protein
MAQRTACTTPDMFLSTLHESCKRLAFPFGKIKLGAETNEDATWPFPVHGRCQCSGCTTCKWRPYERHTLALMLLPCNVWPSIPWKDLSTKPLTNNCHSRCVYVLFADKLRTSRTADYTSTHKEIQQCLHLHLFAPMQSMTYPGTLCLVCLKCQKIGAQCWAPYGMPIP